MGYLINPYRFAAAGGGGVKPSTLSKCQLWVSPQATTGYSDGATMTGSLTDLSGKGNNMPITSGPKWRSGSGPGSGAAFEMIGTGTLDVPFAAYNGLTNAEIMIGVKATTDQSSQSLWSASSGGGGSEHYRYSDGNVYEPFFSSSRYSFNPGSVATHRQYNIAAATNDWTAWLDGSQVFHTSSNTMSQPTSGNFRIGTGFSGFVGMIAYVALFCPVLTTTERADMANFFVLNPNGGLP